MDLLTRPVEGRQGGRQGGRERRRQKGWAAGKMERETGGSEVEERGEVDRIISDQFGFVSSLCGGRGPGLCSSMTRWGEGR